MSRVAIVVPAARVRDCLVALAQAGVVELAGPLPPAEGERVEALRRLERATSGLPHPVARLSRVALDTRAAVDAGAADLLAGEIELQRRIEGSTRHGSFAILVGWAPRDEVAQVATAVAHTGAAVVELPRPSYVEPPTLLRPVRPVRAFRPLVETYGHARYTDIDPTPFAAAAFVLMFGMMFGDAGHGAVLALLGLGLRQGRGRLAPFRPLWPLPVAAGIMAAVFGLLYGEAFGPTGLVPTLWLDPLDEPQRLLAAAVAVGAGLIAVSYAIGVVNRWREGGAAAALLAPSALAGLFVFAGGALATAGWYWTLRAALTAGGAIAGIGVALLTAGFLREAGRGGAAVAEALVEVADAVVRIFANTISFARLAAFGLMHAAILDVVLDAGRATWGSVGGSTLALAVLVVGNALAFALEVLVAGVQALRLEYYELFSRVFAGEGRRFAPWNIPVVEEAP